MVNAEQCVLLFPPGSGYAQKIMQSPRQGQSIFARESLEGAQTQSTGTLFLQYHSAVCHSSGLSPNKNNSQTNTKQDQEARVSSLKVERRKAAVEHMVMVAIPPSCPHSCAQYGLLCGRVDLW